MKINVTHGKKKQKCEIQIYTNETKYDNNVKCDCIGLNLRFGKFCNIVGIFQFNFPEFDVIFVTLKLSDGSPKLSGGLGTTMDNYKRSEKKKN